MTAANRRERKAIREAIHDLAWEAALHVAGGDITTVAHREGRDGRGRIFGMVKFGRQITGKRCECGMTLTAVPTLHRWRGGTHVWPTWFCGICALDQLIEALARLEEYATELALGDAA